MGKSKESRSGKDKATKSSKPTNSDPDVDGNLASLSLNASSQAIDPSLASLFGSSLGPVKAPQRTYTPFKATRATSEKQGKEEEEEEEEGDEDEDEDEDEGDEGDEDEGSTSTTSDTDADDDDDDDDEVPEELQSTARVTKSSATPNPDPERRAKRKRVDDDLEERYMQRLQEEEDKENNKLELKRSSKGKEEPSGSNEAAEEDEGQDSENDSEDEQDGESEEENEKTSDAKGSTGSFPIRHEALEPQKNESLDEAARTVFLGNVPSIAISSKSSYKVLKSVFSGSGKIAKIRFRSIAFSEQIPRKAAFATHKLHEKQQTVNAYVVYHTKEAARDALKLNGAVILDRHIRVDSVAHPAKHDTHRSVFIGNLDFEAQEENLWRHFASCGKIEYVRIVRDSATNVGKGFAYVQFEDVVSVEQALLLDGKKMENDRKLRVTRAKNIKRKNKSVDLIRAPPSKKQKTFVPKEDPRQQGMVGRARKLLGKAGAAKMKKTPESFVFEGTRATESSNPGVKLGGKKRKGKSARAKATTRSSAWKNKAK